MRYEATDVVFCPVARIIMRKVKGKNIDFHVIVGVSC